LRLSSSKYRRNLREKIGLLQSGRLFEWGEERTLLLSEINEKEFYLFLVGFEGFLRQVVRSLKFQL
jgi:hypothetical protein